jgi:glycosyltransferase involved in cell wall biosynthesis
MRKKISIVIPCYNEQENVGPIAEKVREQFETVEILQKYDYEILFMDNDSRDETRSRIRELAEKDSHIKAIFNAKNFGQFNSPYYGMLQTDGDATMLMAADFQDPPEMIAKYVEGWEEGYKIVIGIKAHSTDGSFIYALRCLYYKLIRKFSQVDQIEHFTGFGLYDRAFIEVLRELDDPTPFLRGIVAELGFRRKEIPYDQPKRRAGKTSNNLYTLYDAAMLSFTSYTKIGLRLATFAGAFCSAASMLIAIIYLVMKLIWWDRFQAGLAPLLISMLFLGSVIIFFIGMMGEYVLTINHRLMHRPLVVEEERLNFDK